MSREVGCVRYRWTKYDKGTMTRLMSAFTDADISWQAAAMLSNPYGALPTIH